MVDADQKAVFKAFEAGAMDAVALENNRCFVRAHDAARLHDLVRKRK